MFRSLIFAMIVTLLSAGLAAQTDNSWSAAGNSSLSSGQPGVSAQESSMSADAIINLLQQQPALLQAAKIRVAQALGVNPSTLTDQVLFDRIRQDAILRGKFTGGLAKRGYDTSGSMGPQFGNQAPYGNQGLIANPSQPMQQMPWATESSLVTRRRWQAETACSLEAAHLGAVRRIFMEHSLPLARRGGMALNPLLFRRQPTAHNWPMALSRANAQSPSGCPPVNRAASRDPTASD